MSAETKQQARQALNLVLSDIEGMEDPGMAILYVDEASNPESAPISIAMGGMSVASALACIAMMMAPVRGVTSRASEKPNDNDEAESLGDALGLLDVALELFEEAGVSIAQRARVLHG